MSRLKLQPLNLRPRRPANGMHVITTLQRLRSIPLANRKAVAKLMSLKPKQAKTIHRFPYTKSGKPRDALGEYITRPESFPPSVVIYHNDDFVAIHDKYPKSSLHLLLLPRDPTRSFQHPFDAFEDQEFLAKVRAEVSKLHALAANELRRRHGKVSEQERARQEAMDSIDPDSVETGEETLPPGRDWAKEIMCGVHAHPSMNHLHIHVISVDRHSPAMKHRKHYNSFATPFFVGINDFPLAPDDPRRHPGREGYLKRDLVCWRCGKNFKNHFQELKKHLAAEYEEWRRL